MGTLDQIGESLTESMPEISQHAIDEHNSTQERDFRANGENAQILNFAPNTADNPNGWPRDNRNKPYNPETHEISTATGKAIKKRRGSQNQSSVVSTTPNQNSADIGNAQKAMANGTMIALATFAAMQGIFGEEFKPRKDSDLGDEFQYLSTAYGNYFMATGMVDIPPGWALAIAIGSIAAPRFSMPKTRSKMERLKDFFIGKFFSWRAKKTVKTAERETEKGQFRA